MIAPRRYLHSMSPFTSPRLTPRAWRVCLTGSMVMMLSACAGSGDGGEQSATSDITPGDAILISTDGIGADSTAPLDVMISTVDVDDDALVMADGSTGPLEPDVVSLDTEGAQPVDVMGDIVGTDPDTTQGPLDVASGLDGGDGAVDGEAISIDTAAGPMEGCTDVAQWPTRVLFIGNSYTSYHGGLDAALSSFAAKHPCGDGFAMTTAKYAPGGKKLHQHHVDATTAGSTLYGLINDPLGWDIVVLQDQSQVPGFPKEWSSDKAQTLELLDDWALLIEGVGAQVVFFMTWGRRDGDPNNAIFATFSEMQDLLAAGYQEYAELTQLTAQWPVLVAPVGLGWRVIFDNALSVQVSDEEAHARFTSLYAGDGSHPSVRGTYLAAGVFFEFLTGSTAALGQWVPGTIAPEEKAWLDEAASTAIAQP